MKEIFIQKKDPEEENIDLKEEDSKGDLELREKDQEDNKEQEEIRERLEQLANPEVIEEELREKIEEAERNLEFAEARQEAMIGVGVEAGVEVGGEEITPEIAKEARDLMHQTRRILEKIKQINLKELSLKAAKGIQKYLSENWANFSTLALIPLSALTGGDVSVAARASVELSAGIIALDKVLDVIMSNAEEVIPPQYFVALMAATTNLAEAGASQASAIVGDPISEVGATPIGSNPTNVYLTGFALASAIKERALKEGYIKEGEKMTFSAIKKTLRGIDWKSVKKELGLSGLMALDAIIFQYYVRPQMKKGNFLPLAAWTAINVPLLFEYFKKTTFSKNAKIDSVVRNIDSSSLEKMRQEIIENPEIYGEEGPLKAILEAVEQIKTSEEKKKKEKKQEGKKILQEKVKELQEVISQDPQFKEKVEEFLQKADIKDLKALLQIAGLKLEKKKDIDKKKILKIIAGVASVAAISSLLDRGVTDISYALPYLSKGAAGFFFMSFFSSLGEFITTKKFFQRGRDKEAVKNISDSNALNIGLAKAAMLTSLFRKLI